MAKKRELIDIKKYRTSYSEIYQLWDKRLVHHEYSSFPSENTRGWPHNLVQHNLNAAKFVEQIWHTPVYIGVKLSHYSTTPEQYLMPSQDQIDKIKAEAMNKAMAKFMDGKQQLGADFGERKKTIDMVTSRLRQAYDILRFVKRGNYYAAVRTLKGGRKPKSKKTAELWLEFQYGWKPFVGSIYDICDKEFPPNPEIYINEVMTRPFYETRGNMSTDGRYRSTCSFLVQMQSPLHASAEKLGLMNPVSIAWELVPFSFVVDWFIPISTYLQNLTVFNGYRVVDKCLSYTEKLNMYNVNDKFNMGRSMRRTIMTRNVHIDLGFRAHPKNPLSVTHALNALALIRVLRN